MTIPGKAETATADKKGDNMKYIIMKANAYGNTAVHSIVDTKEQAETEVKRLKFSQERYDNHYYYVEDNTEKQFTLIVSKTRNFSASSLMCEYARNTPGASMARDQYFNNYISMNGKLYSYDHMVLETYDKEHDTVTVFLKEKAL